MSLIERISMGAMQFRADVSGTPAPWDDFWYEPIGRASATGMRVDANAAKRIAAVLACVGIIGKNVAMMPFRIYTDTASGKQTVPSHPVYEMLATRPNDRQTPYEFFQMMQGHVELRGNAYAEIVPGSRSAVEQLVPMHPDRISVQQLETGRLRYVYDDPLTKQKRALLQDEVFHLRNWSDDGITGQSTVAMGCDVFGTALAEQDYTARFFKNDSRPGGIIEGANFKNKEDGEAFVEDFQRKQTGRNRHRVIALPLGLTYKEIGVKPSDAQLLDARKFSRIEICSIFGVPPHLIGETEKTATYASVEQFNIMFAVQCLLPRVVMWEQTIQRDLILQPRFYPKFSMAALLRGDTASRYAAYQIAIQNGWLSQDDVRALEDLNPIPGGVGKTYWRPLNWAPLGQIDAPAAANAQQPDEATIADGADTGNDAAQIGRLKLLASTAAERCVRKETAALQKLKERNADAAETTRFWTEHEGFLVEVLRITPDAARQYAEAGPSLLPEQRILRLAELASGGTR